MSVPTATDGQSGVGRCHRVDVVEASAAELEANQFSTATKLGGEVITYLNDAFGEAVDKRQREAAPSSSWKRCCDSSATLLSNNTQVLQIERLLLQ